MARTFALFLLISLFATTLALRGQSSNSVRRLAEVGPLGGEEDEEYVGTVKENHKSKSPKQSSKSKKQSKADKKCKKAKSSKSSKSEMTMEPASEGAEIEDATERAPEGAEVDETMEPAPEETEVEASTDYCLHGELSAQECAAIKNGDLPKDDAAVKGTLEMDIAFEDDPNQVQRTLGEILRTETPAKFVGCEKRRIRLLLENTDNEEEASTETYLSVTGVDFDQVEISKQGMFKTEANIYFEGKDDVSDEEAQEMFDLLAETILIQASTGSFAEVGELRSVQASSSPDGSSSGAGMPIGVAVGGVVVVGALAGLFFYMRKGANADSHKKGCQADTSDDESVVRARAVLVDDDTKDKKKEDTQEVEATLVSVSNK